MKAEEEETIILQVINFTTASMSNMHLAAIKYRITPLNFSGSMSFCSSLDGTHKNEGVKRYSTLNQQHLELAVAGQCGSKVDGRG